MASALAMLAAIDTPLVDATVWLVYRNYLSQHHGFSVGNLGRYLHFINNVGSSVQALRKQNTRSFNDIQTTVNIVQAKEKLMIIMSLRDDITSMIDGTFAIVYQPVAAIASDIALTALGHPVIHLSNQLAHLSGSQNPPATRAGLKTAWASHSGCYSQLLWVKYSMKGSDSDIKAATALPDVVDVKAQLADDWDAIQIESSELHSLMHMIHRSCTLRARHTGFIHKSTDETHSKLEPAFKVGASPLEPFLSYSIRDPCAFGKILKVQGSRSWGIYQNGLPKPYPYTIPLRVFNTPGIPENPYPYSDKTPTLQ
ncbi:hypothetical protein JB92DRAFT_2830801 [Gautieria morchelliformis]|nr:hypothetical protein JB92DRAFT_2830801 [Gautieria morchelliformis]